jgi:protein-disulfide isomerase
MTDKPLTQRVLTWATLAVLGLAFGLCFLKPPGLGVRSAAVAADMSQDEFERRVRDYLLAHPEVVGDALARLEAKQGEDDAAAGRAALKDRSTVVFHDPDSPVSGNPNGDVTLVEFFDYNCPYCKMMAPVMEQTEAADPQLRIVYKEFPILGPGSEFAAKAALAANKQGKYGAFRHALYQVRGHVDEAQVLEAAKAVGLDVDRMKADMQDAVIESELAKNAKLGEILHITGTPGFVIGNQITTGATDAKSFAALIAKARSSSIEAIHHD